LGLPPPASPNRIHQETKRRPIDVYQEENPHLLPLPAHPYDTALLLHRKVNLEGCVPYLQNFYSVPWQRMGELLPFAHHGDGTDCLRPDLTEFARHELYPAGTREEKHTLPKHSPGRDSSSKIELLLRNKPVMWSLPFCPGSGSRAVSRGHPPNPTVWKG